MTAMPEIHQNIPARAGLAAALRAFPHPGGIIVHPERRILYMKAAKTAGTSIFRKVLEPQLGGFIHLKDQPEAFGDWLDGITDEALSSYYIFAVVRDPWDRFQSMAAHLKQPLQDLIENFDQITAKEPAFSHTLPQIGYTHLNGVPFVDRICSFETLADDFAALCRDLGLPDYDLPHANRSNRARFAATLTADQIAWIGTRYHDDARAYGYAAPLDIKAGEGGL